VYGQLELARRCLSSLDRWTPAAVELVVIDDCGPERVIEADVDDAVTTGRDWRLVRHDVNRGFVGSVNHAFELADEDDVIVVNSDVEVLSGWFEPLVEAASSGPRVASVSSVADNGGLLSVPALGRQIPSPRQLEILRGRVPATAPIPVAVAHCTLFTRPALDAVGGFDQHFAPGYGEEVDWSLRAQRLGFRHLAALHSLVIHAQSASFGPDLRLFSTQRRHELRLLARYPRRWFGVRSFARSTDTDLRAGLTAISDEIARIREPRGPRI